MEHTDRADQQDDHVRISVQDNGIGIPGEQLENVFNMFEQLRSSVGHSERGLGVGLALVRSLAELHGGSVVATSGGIGKGSEFTVRLPL